MNKHNLNDEVVDFLMTYGWVILASIIAICVLAYFGVFNPDRYNQTLSIQGYENNKSFGLYGNLTMGNFKSTTCYGIFISCKYCSDFTKEQKQGYIIGVLFQVGHGFPINISLTEKCPIQASGIYYNINELPVEDVCLDINKTSCLWKFDWGKDDN